MINIKTEYLELKAKDNAIHCNSCEARIKNTLSNKLRILNITADHQTQKIQLYFDKDEINIVQIKDILEEMGFPSE